jgi:hypothetical protein
VTGDLAQRQPDCGTIGRAVRVLAARQVVLFQTEGLREGSGFEEGGGERVATLWAKTHAVPQAEAEIVSDKDRSARDQHKAQQTSFWQRGRR